MIDIKEAIEIGKKMIWALGQIAAIFIVITFGLPFLGVNTAMPDAMFSSLVLWLVFIVVKSVTANIGFYLIEEMQEVIDLFALFVMGTVVLAALLLPTITNVQIVNGWWPAFKLLAPLFVWYCYLMVLASLFLHSLSHYYKNRTTSLYYTKLVSTLGWIKENSRFVMWTLILLILAGFLYTQLGQPGVAVTVAVAIALFVLDKAYGAIQNKSSNKGKT